jgi:repressor LexA
MGVIKITPGISRGIQLVDAGFAQIPLMGDVEAGLPRQAQEMPTEFVKIDKRLVTFKDPVALRVRGFSMQDAGILPGDIVLIRDQKTASHGETVVAYLNGGITVKKLLLRGPDVILQPANPSFKEIEVHRDDEFTILGKVMLILRDLGDCFDFQTAYGASETGHPASYN